jgi:hypothetical protein
MSKCPRIKNDKFYQALLRYFFEEDGYFKKFDTRLEELRAIKTTPNISMAFRRKCDKEYNSLLQRRQ